MYFPLLRALAIISHLPYPIVPPFDSTLAKNTRGKTKQNYFEAAADVTDILIFLMYYIFLEERRGIFHGYYFPQAKESG